MGSRIIGTGKQPKEDVIMSKITKIVIEALNDEFDLEFDLKGDHCILVGPNGVGKSTALQVIAHALGRKWSLLSDQRFKAIEIQWGEDFARISKSECEAYSFNMRGGFVQNLEKRLRARGEIERFLEADLTSSSERRYFATPPVPQSSLFALQRKLRAAEGEEDSESSVDNFINLLDRKNVPRTIFLPTSRRIEVELAKISEGMPEFLSEKITEYFEDRSSSKYFEEIVRFGMEDIENIIRQFELSAQAESRNKFNFLMANLLKEMANGKSISVRDVRERNLTEEEIRRVLSRIEEGVLSSTERSKIVDTITSLSSPQAGGGNPAFHKKWLAHFFVRLQEADVELSEFETPMLRFVEAIQKYMTPKEVRYDIETSKFSMTAPSGRPIELSELSSGEKQLTAMIAMLEFSQERTNVFIDEPELSLSVPWQTSILTDIVGARSCQQLFAVTHSPFVFENTLETHVIDFADCLVPHG